MQRAPKVSLVTLILWLVIPAAAAAQERQGLWAGFGGGWGSAEVQAAELEDQDRANSGVGRLQLGWTMNDNWLVGAELDFWRKNTEIAQGVDANFNIYNLSGILAYYASASSRFFVKGGAGVSYLNADYDFSGADVRIDLGSGFGFIVGAGYDIPLTGSISLTPAVNLWYGQLGDLEFEETTLFTDWKQNVFDVTIGITFH
jgi:hypothetical protein